MSQNTPSLAGTPTSETDQELALQTVQVEILEPLDDALVYAEQPIDLRASAYVGPEDISSQIRWRSNLDGFLGEGGEIQAVLSRGRHTLRAGVEIVEDTVIGTRSRTRSRTGSQTNLEQDTVTVCAAPAGDPVHYSGGDTCPGS